MHKEISALLQWKQEAEASFITGKYSRVHTWHLDGGGTVKASSSPEIVPIPFSAPEWIDPEEAFILSLASCHMLFFLSFAAKRRINVLKYEDQPIGILAKNDDGRIAMTSVTLQPRVKLAAEVATETLAHLHELAHKQCFIANSVKTQIQIKPQ